MYLTMKDGKLELPKDNFIIEFEDDNKAKEIFNYLLEQGKANEITAKQLLTTFIEQNLDNIGDCYFSNLNDIAVEDDEDDEED